MKITIHELRDAYDDSIESRNEAIENHKPSLDKMARRYLGKYCSQDTMQDAYLLLVSRLPSNEVNAISISRYALLSKMYSAASDVRRRIIEDKMAEAEQLGRIDSLEQLTIDKGYSRESIATMDNTDSEYFIENRPINLDLKEQQEQRIQDRVEANKQLQFV